MIWDYYFDYAKLILLLFSTIFPLGPIKSSDICDRFLTAAVNDNLFEEICSSRVEGLSVYFSYLLIFSSLECGNYFCIECLLDLGLE